MRHALWRVRSAFGLAKEPRRFSEVIEGKIYRSGLVDPQSLQWVAQQTGIKTVIDLGAFEDGSPEDRAIQDACERLGLCREVYRLRGTGAGDPQQYVHALKKLRDETALPALVHCAAGAQRTGACVLLYRHLFEGVRMIDAYRETVERGHPEGEWRLLAYIAENLETIREGVREN